MPGAQPPQVAVLLSHGAGASSASGWMLRYAELLGALGPVQSFDYPYMRLGKKVPDPLPKLLAAHREELRRFREQLGSPAPRLLLAGKSMGGRVGCHVALEDDAPSGLVCFGFPLRSQSGKLRDAVLLELRRPVLFVQGERDPLCPLEELARVRERMSAPSELFVVEGGDHSLLATKGSLKQRGTTQEEVERAILSAVRRFADGLPPP